MVKSSVLGKIMPEALSNNSDIVKRFLTEVRSVDDFAAFFAEDAIYHFANYPSISGRENIRQSSIGFRQRLKSVTHNIKNIWEIEDTVVCEMDVVYTRLDNKVVTVPCCDVIKLKNNLFQEIHIYIDMSPVFAP